MFAEQIHSRIVLNNLSRKKEYFVIAFFYVVSGNYSTFSPVSRSGIGERPKERSSGEEGLKR